MLNEREKIQHWRVRNSMSVAIGALLVCGLLLVMLAGLSITMRERPWWSWLVVGAFADAILAAALLYRVVRLRRRLQKLEEFV